jgi:LysR family hydrogen peroxide-inducible transcriptional activator
MELHQLRYFVAAAECGNLGRAADRCHVAQPSPSQQLKKLESFLGVTLFDRVGRGILITDAGRALLPRARQILATFASIFALDVTAQTGSRWHKS